MLTLYGKPNCVQCTAVRRWLAKHDLEYDYHDVSASEYDRGVVRNLGYQQVPVVVLPDGSHFYGFQPDKLESWRASL